jgi:cholesterol transport system auxiliary component
MTRTSPEDGEPERWKRRRLLALAVVLPAGLATASCLQLGQGQPPRRFRLNLTNNFPPDLPTVDWTLEIDQTVADPGIDTTRIAQLGANGVEIQYFADAEWPSNASDMVNTLLVQSFVDSRRITRVGDRNSGLRPDFTLKTVLRNFEAESGPTPTI